MKQIGDLKAGTMFVLSSHLWLVTNQNDEFRTMCVRLYDGYTSWKLSCSNLDFYDIKVIRPPNETPTNVSLEDFKTE